mmetsp:Transcript_12916/g.24435  ORF Transcript_12916/g.24435 Transcript_12916/m.24435 type:complete len:121 (-) Transcript_12916:62-424(-)
MGRVEPKTFFANERTFLSWLNMAVTLGTIASAMLGYSSKFGTEGQGQLTTTVIGLTLLPISIAFVAYATYSFHKRVGMIRRNEDGPFDSIKMPMTLAVILILALWVIFLTSLVSYLKSNN